VEEGDRYGTFGIKNKQNKKTQRLWEYTNLVADHGVLRLVGKNSLERRNRSRVYKLSKDKGDFMAEESTLRAFESFGKGLIKE